MKPILFSAPMVQALLNTKPGTWPPEPIDPSKPCKGMTRRVIKHYGKTPEQYGRDKFYKLVNELNGKQGLYAGFYKDSDVFMYEGEQHTDAIYFKARYQPGDVLYVQETWKAVIAELARFEILIEYRADGFRQWIRFTPERFAKFRKFASKNGWQSPYFMPREAARLFLTVKEEQVERLQEITEEDAIAEGISVSWSGAWHNYAKTGLPKYISDPRESFSTLWDSLNGKKYPWEANDWVWAISLERRGAV